MSEEQAVAAAEEFLQGAYGAGPPTIVMEPEKTVEHRQAWAVRFDSQEHRDTGDFTQAPFVRVVIVPKDGSPVHFPPTAYPVDRYLGMIESGEMSWPAKQKPAQ